MDPQHLSFAELFTHIIGDMARAISERPNEIKQQQFIRMQVATRMILGLEPRDVIEAMLAGQTIMFHALMTDSIHDTLQGQIDTMRHGTRSNIVTINKAFHMNLGKLERYQTRLSEGTREVSATAPEAEAQESVMGGERAEKPGVARKQANAARPASPGIVMQVPFPPSEEDIAACRANPEAMAALKANDFARFARAMGVAQPSEAYLKAAASLAVPTGGQAAGPQAGSGAVSGTAIGNGRLPR
jgi:hypothetical protein